MFHSTRRMVWCAALSAVLALTSVAGVVRADDQDYNAYWQEQAKVTNELQQGQTPHPGNTQDDNAYWQRQADVAAAQQRL